MMKHLKQNAVQLLILPNTSWIYFSNTPLTVIILHNLKSFLNFVGDLLCCTTGLRFTIASSSLVYFFPFRKLLSNCSLLFLHNHYSTERMFRLWQEMIKSRQFPAEGDMTPYVHQLLAGIREQIKQLITVVPWCVGVGRTYDTFCR